MYAYASPQAEMSRNHVQTIETEGDICTYHPTIELTDMSTVLVQVTSVKHGQRCACSSPTPKQGSRERDLEEPRPF